MTVKRIVGPIEHDIPTTTAPEAQRLVGGTGKWAIQVGWEDAPHLSPEARAQMEGAIQPHERDARMRGIPSLGAGAIYPVPESEITCEPFIIPDHFTQVYALDVGWNRTAALWGAHDTGNDILYLTGEYYRGQAEPSIHATAIKARGEWMPGVIDPASRGRSQKDGEQILALYLGSGLNLTLANNAVDAGIQATWERLSTGRLRVFRTLQAFWNEYRIYRRDEKGNIVKVNDHLMDDMRYLVMSGLAIASVRPAEQWSVGRRAQHLSDYDAAGSLWGRR